MPINDEPEVYARCLNDCLRPTYTQNQIKSLLKNGATHALIETNTGTVELSLWSGTRAEYNALDSTDGNTIYYITDDGEMFVDPNDPVKVKMAAVADTLSVFKGYGSTVETGGISNTNYIFTDSIDGGYFLEVVIDATLVKEASPNLPLTGDSRMGFNTDITVRKLIWFYDDGDGIAIDNDAATIPFFEFVNQGSFDYYENTGSGIEHIELTRDFYALGVLELMFNSENRLQIRFIKGFVNILISDHYFEMRESDKVAATKIEINRVYVKKYKNSEVE